MIWEKMAVVAPALVLIRGGHNSAFSDSRHSGSCSCRFTRRTGRSVKLCARRRYRHSRRRLLLPFYGGNRSFMWPCLQILLLRLQGFAVPALTIWEELAADLAMTLARRGWEEQSSTPRHRFCLCCVAPPAWLGAILGLPKLKAIPPMSGDR